MGQYIWENDKWPNFTWDSDALLEILSKARLLQGRLIGQADLIGLETQAEILCNEAIMTSAIEGEKLDKESVRSSVTRRLGLEEAGLPEPQKHVDGLVSILLDATQNYKGKLSAERIKSWHAALFPTGYSGMRKITVANWRKGTEPMQVISGPLGKEKVHFEAPPSDKLKVEINKFLRWWESSENKMDGIIRSGISHLWFVTIHPFDDGNGRLARAITDMAIAQDENTGRRLYSVSAQIMNERKAYYEILEKTQKSDGELTPWLLWFIEMFINSISNSEEIINKVISISKFWKLHSDIDFNERQKKVVSRLLEMGPGGFEGGLTNKKYKSMTKVSRETAKRDLSELLKKGVLKQNEGRGRSVSYDLKYFKE